MRVLVAPAEFKGSLTASAAARAIANGWSSQCPDDSFDICPLSDGGPGFLDALATSLDGELASVTVHGPRGERVPGAVFLDGDTAYVESAQACGWHLVDPDTHDPVAASTFGVGELLTAARELGARRIVVGLGGSATTDAGAGMLAALGAEADVDLRGGGGALRGVGQVDLSRPLADFAGIDLIAASDVDNPLLGLTGTAKSFGPQKGATDDQVQILDAAMTDFAETVGRTDDGKSPAIAKGAGAAGGLGYALLLLGARRVAGIATVADIVNLDARIADCDVVVTGEGTFDWQSMRGKVVSGVAQASLPLLRPCVVIAGQVTVGRREFAAAGIASAYSASEIVGSVSHSLADPVSAIEETAARVARTWGMSN